jgi:hypothetical protein
MFTVTLSHATNPDIPGGYWDGRPSEGRATVEAETMQSAARMCRDYIERNGLGAGNWTGGKVREGGKQVARVSYNGRVWNMTGAEIK